MEKLNSLEVSLTIGCRLDCKYCPQRLLLSRYFENNPTRNAQLKFEDFKKALEQVKEGAEISFCGMSEPFHNRECADMIVYAYNQGYKIALLTTLVGMTLEDYQKIKDIKFDSFVLHIPDQDYNSKFDITDEYLELFKLVNNNILIDYYSCHGVPHEKIKPYINKDKYAGIALGDRAGNLTLEENKIVKNNKTGEIVCYHGSERQVGGWSPVMLPDGTLILCCQDYGLKHQLGNLVKETWETIKAGKEVQKFFKGLKDDSIDILCRKCGDSRMVKDLPAMRIKKIVDMVKNDKSQLEGIDSNSVIYKLATAQNVGIFGAGKLFRDHFFQEHWDEGLDVKIIFDNNEKLQGSKIGNIMCESSRKASTYEKMFVVIFVKNANEIKNQLQEEGIYGCATLDEIMDEYCELIGNNAKRLSL